jgi:hypothetical protein
MPSHTNSNHQPGAKRLRYANAVLLSLSFLWCVYWFVHAWHYWEDDAFIHLEFARSVANHRGFAFDGKIVSGDTAPLWVFLLIAAHELVPDWIVAGKLLSALGVLLGLTGAYALARRLSHSLPGSQLFPAALVLLIAVNPYFCYWSFSGMEPLAAAGVALWATLAATAERPSTQFFVAGCLLAGIAPLLRPEMIFLTAILAPLFLAQWAKLPGRADSIAKLASSAAGLILILGPVIAWSLYSFHAFGHLIPNTNAAKRAAASDSVLLRLLTAYALAFPVILCGALTGIASALFRPGPFRESIENAFASAFTLRLNRQQETRNSTHSSPLAGWIFIVWSIVTTAFYIANHTYVQTRYILVTAPALTIVAMFFALAISRRIYRAVYAIALLAALAVSLVTVRPFLRNKGLDDQATQALALFIRDHIPPDAPIAVFGIGEVVFYSEHPIVDTGGITQPGAIPYLAQPQQAMLEWARTQGARYYISSQPIEPGSTLVFTAPSKYIGWTIHTSLYSQPTNVSLWQLPPLNR